MSHDNMNTDRLNAFIAEARRVAARFLRAVGHPQAPTAGRAIIEGIEETVMKGGGYLLFAGCAAGDTGGALVVKVS